MKKEEHTHTHAHAGIGAVVSLGVAVTSATERQAYCDYFWRVHTDRKLMCVC